MNPEFDYLEIHLEGFTRDAFIKFLHDLKTVYDPLHIGLLNLVIGLHTLNPWDLRQLSDADLDTGAGSAFKATLAQLREVFFVFAPHNGRQNFGLMSGMNVRQKSYNRFLPIIARTPTFERYPDPRPIAEDLKKVYVGDVDPRFTVGLWQRML